MNYYIVKFFNREEKVFLANNFLVKNGWIMFIDEEGEELHIAKEETVQYVNRIGLEKLV